MVGGCLETLEAEEVCSATLQVEEGEMWRVAVAAAEQTLEGEEASGTFEAFGRAALPGEVVVEVVEGLDIHEIGVNIRLGYTHLVVYQGEGLLALGCRHRYPRVPPPRQEVGPQA